MNVEMDLYSAEDVLTAVNQTHIIVAIGLHNVLQHQHQHLGPHQQRHRHLDQHQQRHQQVVKIMRQDVTLQVEFQKYAKILRVTQENGSFLKIVNPVDVMEHDVTK